MSRYTDFALSIVYLPHQQIAKMSFFPVRIFILDCYPQNISYKIGVCIKPDRTGVSYPSFISCAVRFGEY